MRKVCWLNLVKKKKETYIEALSVDDVAPLVAVAVTVAVWLLAAVVVPEAAAAAAAATAAVGPTPVIKRWNISIF